MNELELIHKKLDAILAHLNISTLPAKFMTAKQVESHYGISAKTLLNRSKLPQDHKRYIPALCLKGGRKKYFEKKVLDRILLVSQDSAI